MFKINHDEIMEKLMETSRNEDFSKYPGNIYDDDVDVKLFQAMENCVNEQKQNHFEEVSAF